MDESWLSVSQVAEQLEVSPAHVRRLIRRAELPAVWLGRAWLVDPSAVARRRQRASRGGRALSPVIAWQLLHELDRPAGHAGEGMAWSGLSAVQRHRLRALIANLPDAPNLLLLLRERAERHVLRAHPGVLERLAADPCVSRGAGRAAAAHGVGIAAGGRDMLYLPAEQLEEVIARYRLQPHPDGNVELAAIPTSVPEKLRPAAGLPVPMSVAWVDLLEDPDPRAAGAARDWLDARRAATR